MNNELVYLTGLSIDKKSLNASYKDFATDPGVIAYTDDIKAICKKVKLENEMLRKIKEEVGDELTDATAEEIAEYIDKILEGVEVLTEMLGVKSLKSLFGLIGNSYDKFTNQKVDQLSPFLARFVFELATNEFLQKRITDFKPLDFFNVYLSNQSDSRGVPAIAKLSSKRKGLRAHWGYCDRPFYANYFIDNIEIKVCNENLKNSKFVKDVHDQFVVHGLDIVFSRLVESIAGLKEEGNKSKNISDILKSQADDFSRKIGKSLSERGFFGIDLLSRLLTIFYFAKNKNTDDKQKPLVILIDSDINKPKNKENKKNNPFKDLEKYIIELLELSSDPEAVEIIYGKTNKKYDLLVRRPDMKTYRDNLQVDGFVKADAIKHAFINKSEFKFIVPIKLFLSLPLVLDKHEMPNKISQKHLLPDLLTTDTLRNAEVLTTGGVEHNRPLMHLINAHRKQRKDKRVFGFLDNHFDFIHRWNNQQREGYEHLFIMGIAQPVSGFNEVYIKRTEDSVGLSDSPEAKHIIFKVKCTEENKEITVLSSYGFSALASVYATLRIITRLLTAIKKDKKKLLKNTIDTNKGDYVNLNEGYSWKVIFSKMTEKRMYETSHDLDPFSVVTSEMFKEESKQLVKLFKRNEHNGGVIKRIHIGKITNKGQ